MGGLLDAIGSTPRTCRYGHGPMSAVPGAWLFSQAQSPAQAPPGLLGALQQNLQFAVRLHTCPVCGYVEMSDFPAPGA